MEPAPGTTICSLIVFLSFLSLCKDHGSMKAEFLRNLINGGLIFCRRILQIHQNTSFFQILILFQADRWPKALVNSLNVLGLSPPPIHSRQRLFVLEEGLELHKIFDIHHEGPLLEGFEYPIYDPRYNPPDLVNFCSLIWSDKMFSRPPYRNESISNLSRFRRPVSAHVNPDEPTHLQTDVGINTIGEPVCHKNFSYQDQSALP